MKRKYFSAFLIVFVLMDSSFAFSLSPKSIPAKAAIVMDDRESVIYSKNPDAKLPPASTVKLVTAMVVLERLDPGKTVRISRYAASVRSVRPRLRRDEELTVADLLHLTLMKSINSAAVALAEEAAGSEQEFVALMNRKARDIGANDTLFANATGLPESVQYTTARDLALIMKEALSYPMIREIIGKKEYRVTTAGGRKVLVKNTDKLLWQRENVIGGKTGFTCSARHCFVGAMDTGRGIIITAVLGAASRYRLWRSTEKLFDLGTRSDLIGSSEIPLKSRYIRKVAVKKYSKNRARPTSRKKMRSSANRA
jgi:D-alanyl-D-alanine carboxypeptidase (penicillin-binding protein 5/6)